MAWRLPLLAVVNFGCLGLLLACRLVERPLFGLRRPFTPQITRFVCRTSLAILGIRHEVHGEPIRPGGSGPEEAAGAMVANHASWLDIYALNAPAPVYFVSKAEVARWPGIGWLARATGTVFIRRERREARLQTALLRERLAAGHLLLFFPEGTSSDGLRVLPFKTTLFEAFRPGPGEGGAGPIIQPVSLIYHAPEGADRRFYGWWGEMSLGPHLLKVLAAPRQGRIEVVYHAPMRVADFADRKSLARALEARVREGLRAALPEAL